MKKGFIEDLPNYMASVLFSPNDPLRNNVNFCVLAYIVGFFAYLDSFIRSTKNENK